MTASLIPALLATSTQFCPHRLRRGWLPEPASLVEFAAKGYVAATAMLTSVVPAMVSTAAGFVTMAATGIASAIAGFVAYIPIAIAAAAATLAAAAPFLAVGAAGAAVIGVIILLVTHWKQVTDFLSTVWKIIVAGVRSRFHRFRGWSRRGGSGDQ